MILDRAASIRHYRLAYTNIYGPLKRLKSFVHFFGELTAFTTMVRGGTRGRGRGGHMKPRPPFIPHVPFDIVLAEPAFPQVRPKTEVSEAAEKLYTDVSIWMLKSVRIFSWLTQIFSLTFLNLQALVKKNQDLTPSQAEQTALTNLVTKIQTVLDGLIVSPGSFDACVSQYSCP